MDEPHYRLRTGRLRQDLAYLELHPGDSPIGLPAVLILHGKGGNKERELPLIYRYAQLGFRAIAIDLHRHGGRLNAESRERDFMIDPTMTMVDIIRGSVADISVLLDDFKLPSIGVLGVSLGGITMFEAVSVEARIKVAVSIVGSPSRSSLARSVGLTGSEPHLSDMYAGSPHLNAAKFLPPRPLLMLHGALDEVVYPEGVVDLNRTLAPYYASTPERLELVIYPDVAHEATEHMLRLSLAWFDRYRTELL